MSEQTDGAASSSSNAEPVPEWASPQATIVTSSTPTSLINTEPASQDVSSDELATTTNNEDSTEGAAVAGMAGLCVLTDALGAFGIPSTEQHSLAHSSTAPLAQEIEYDTYLAETSNLSTTTVIPNRVDHLKTQAPTLSASMMEIDQNMATEMDLRQAEVLRSVPSAQNSRQSPESLFVGRDEQITTAAPSRNNKRGIDSVLANAEDHSEELEHRGTKRLKAEPQMPVDPLGSLDIGEDGTVIPYNPSREARPRCAAYHPEFSKVEALVVHVTKTSLQAIEQAIADGLRDDEIERIYGALTNLCSLESKYPSVRPVAIFGPAGVGKSNTINSALNQKAAAESDSANRGTNLVHEYSAPTSQQLAKYEIAARYLAGRGLSNFVVGHCDSIFDFLDREADSEEEEGGLEDLQQSYETSCNLFTILLCDHEEFESEGKVSDYFASNRDDRPAAYEELKDLIKRLKASRSLEDEVEYHQARTTRELAEKVEVRTDNDLLNAGLLLGDTPGTSDSNQAVVSSTTNYIKTAGLTLITEGVKRILDSATLDKNLQQLIQLGKTTNIGLIVTSIDTLAGMSDEAKDELLDEDKAIIDETEEYLTHLKEEKRQLDRQTRARGRVMDQSLFQKIQDLPNQIALAEAHRAQTVIQFKTRDVEKKLKEKLRTISRSRHAPDLEVFFVSNTEYAKHVQGYDPTRPPILDVEATGIPALRRRLFKEPAIGKGSTLKRICEIRLPKILLSITGVLTKSRLERKNHVENMIRSVLDKDDEVLGHFLDDLKRAFEFSVLKVFSDPSSRLVEKGGKLADDLKAIHSSTFQACCRKGGQHTVKKRNVTHDWNAKIQSLFADKVAKTYDNFIDEVTSAESSLMCNTADFFLKLENELEENQDFQGVKGQQEFIVMVRKIRDGAMRPMSFKRQAMLDDFNEVRSRCIFKPDNSSYVSESMEDTYHSCANVAIVQPREKGVKKRGIKKKDKAEGPKTSPHATRIDIIRAKLTGNSTEPSVFDDVAHSAKTDFDERVSKWIRDEYTRTLKKASEDILRDFNNRFAVQEEDIKQEHPEAVEKLKIAIEDCLQVVNGELKDSVKRWEGFEDWSF